jgi:hypothetical protein
MRNSSFVMSALLALISSAVLAAAPAPSAPQFPPVVQTFVAQGPAGEEGFRALTSALEATAGVVTVDLRPTVGGAFVHVKGDVLFTLLEANAQPAGYRLQLMPTRLFTAPQLTDAADLSRLRVALEETSGVHRAVVSPDSSGAAVRVNGIAKYQDLVERARAVGFDLRQIGGYVASGASTPEALASLDAALRKVPGVELVEMLGLAGGATLLIHGEVEDETLKAAAKAAGYSLWALRTAGRLHAEFSVAGQPDETEQRRLVALVEGLEGSREVTLEHAENGLQLVVGGDRLRPDRIAAAAAEAGFQIRVVERVTLPTLTPQAGRNTPAAYEDAVVADPIVEGEMAPTFTLLSKDGTSTHSLADSRGKKPVVLIFGSCT